MTKSEFVTEILKSFDDASEETFSNSVLGEMVRKVSFTKGQLSTLLFAVLNNKHVTWTD